MTSVFTLRIPAAIEKRLKKLARKTGRTRSFYAREAILRHLEDFEDYYIAKQRLARKVRGISLDALERECSAV